MDGVTIFMYGESRRREKTRNRRARRGLRFRRRLIDGGFPWTMGREKKRQCWQC